MECPNRHERWKEEEEYDEFLHEFGKTLSQRLDRQWGIEADYARTCAGEANGGAGFSCEMAANKLGLLRQMIRFGCRTVKCEDLASCSRFPRSPAVK